MPFTTPMRAFAGGVLLATSISLVAVQPWQAKAAPGDDDTTFVPVAPCRLFDTRPAATQGARRAPLSAGETFTTPVTGSNGDCLDIPSDATGVAMNVTIVNPTARSFLSVFPADLATRSEASNLNWDAGQAPTPNKVDVPLSPTGEISLFNNNGTVNVFADVVGYYTPSSLLSIQAQLDALKAADTALDARITDQRSTTQSVDGSDRTITTAWTNVVQLSAPISRDGRVLVFASGTAFENTAGDDVQCVVTDVPDSVVADRGMLWEASGATAGSAAGEGDAAVVSGTRSFNVSSGTFATFALMCRNTVSGTSQIWDPHITVLFVRS